MNDDTLLHPCWRETTRSVDGVDGVDVHVVHVVHVVEAGEAGRPLPILLHGFPEFWWAWRKQITPSAEARFHVVVPDMRL